MTRDTPVQIHTTEEYKQRLQARADQSDQSLSMYGHELIEEHLNGNENGSNQVETLRELEILLENLRTDLTGILDEFQSETAEEILDVEAVRTAYLIAIWKLLETEYSVAERRYAMRFAAAHAGVNPEIISTDSSPELEETDNLAMETLVPALASVVGSGDD